MRFAFLFCGIFIGTIIENKLAGLPIIWSLFWIFASISFGMYLFKKKRSRGILIAFVLLGIFVFSLRLGIANHQEMAGRIQLGKEAENRLALTIIDKVKDNGEYRIYLGELMEERRKVYVYGLADGFNAGEIINVPMKYKEPPFKRNFGDMDYKKYLNSKGIYLWASATGKPERLGQHVTNLSVLPIRARNRLEQQIDKYMKGEAAALSKAMLLGDSKLLPEDLAEAFRNGGVSHILSVSGLHVGYFYLLFHFIFRAFKKKGAGKMDFSIGIPVAITFMYVLISGFQAPAVRSFLMFSIPKLGGHIFRKEKGVKKDYLALTGIIMLLLNPFLIYDVGFLISFSCIFAMGEITFGIKKPLNAVHQLIILSAAAWLGSLPFILWSFGRVSIAGLISNIPLIPISGICTIVGVLAMITSLFSSVIGSFLFFLTELLMKLLIAITKGFAMFFPVFVIPRLPFLVILALTLGLFYKFSKEKKSTFMKWAIGLIISAGILQLIFTGGFRFGLEIDFLDVGQGDSAIVRLPKGGQLLVDGGSEGDFLISVLNKMGFFKIDSILITHAHSDHAAGAIKAIEAYRPKRVILPKSETVQDTVYAGSSESEPELNGWEQVKTLQKKLDFEIIEVEAGDKLNIGGTVLQVLLPDGVTFSEEDENSKGIVCLLTYKDFDCLFTADSGIAEEQVYGENLMGQEIEVLKIPHHGSKYSSGEQLINRVRPLLGIVSVGKNMYGHPSAKVLESYTAIGTKILRTDQRGAIRIYSNGETYKIQSVR